MFSSPSSFPILSILLSPRSCHHSPTRRTLLPARYRTFLSFEITCLACIGMRPSSNPPSARTFSSSGRFLASIAGSPFARSTARRHDSLGSEGGLTRTRKLGRLGREVICARYSWWDFEKMFGNFHVARWSLALGKGNAGWKSGWRVSWVRNRRVVRRWMDGWMKGLPGLSKR